MEVNDFVSREYQTELYEAALDNNLIIYLPTGSGKTFIATLLIKKYGSEDYAIKHIFEGGKRIFFLVNTVALVEQQAKHIQSQAPLQVGRYSGDMGVDLWDAPTWIQEINGNQVLVMTCQIFLDLIEKNVISLSSVSLLIFDECHRGVSNHPMRQVMTNFKTVSPDQRPRVLGLTATLLNGNIKPNSVQEEIRKLEVTFLAKIATSINEDMVKMYSTNPTENYVIFSENDKTGAIYTLRDKILNNTQECIAIIEVEEPVMIDRSHRPKNAWRIDSNHEKVNKNLKNLIEDIKVNMDDLGVFGGSFAVLAHLVQLAQMIPNCQLELTKLVYETIIADCMQLRKLFEMHMNSRGLSDISVLKEFSSDKVNKLLTLLRRLDPKDTAIIFVKRRFTAKILHYLLKRASAVDEKLGHIKSNFMVGYNMANPFKDTRENYLHRTQHRRVMNQFNQGELNVLIASNVVEEGVDIQKCNTVIMFDPPLDFRSYIQSKGRARDQSSRYIFMVSKVELRSFDDRIKRYCQTQEVLKQILYDGKCRNRAAPTEEEVNESLFAEKPGLEPFRPLGDDGPVITALSAISLINRYFCSLKLDKFTKPCPIWWLQEDKCNRFRCMLLLPMESKVRGLVEGTWQTTKEDAKRSVALEAAQKLYYSDELNEYLLPAGCEIKPVQFNNVLPNYEEKGKSLDKDKDGNIIQLGTNKAKRPCQKKWPECLSQCRPQPNMESYLHVIQINPVYNAPADNHRLWSIHHLLDLPNNFAMLSSKKLPKLAQFPLYLSTGELEATVIENCPITLDENQIKKIDDFHSTIFDDVLCVAKKFMIRDFSNMQNAYLVVPVMTGPHQKITIDWNIIEETYKPFPSINSPPTQEERSHLMITDQNYLEKIVTPWYRTVPAQKYIVTKVCHDMSESSKFPNDTYSNYKEYFEDKYRLETIVQNQPLLEVRALSSRIKSTKPRAQSKQEKKRQSKDENEDFEVWLLPEFCVVYPLQGRYWMKAQLLPSALHRVSELCSAEELRLTIAQHTHVGAAVLPAGAILKKLEQDISLQKKEDDSEKEQALKPLSNMLKPTSVKQGEKLWEDEEPVDLEREMDTITIFDIENYSTFIKKPMFSTPQGHDKDLSVLTGPDRNRFDSKVTVEPPALKMLQNKNHGFGPQQVELMQALTVAGANDFVNCERLETLGDSFLKFAVSVVLFETYPDMYEGVLTGLKGKIVGNRNLYCCGKNKNIGSILEVQDFSPKEEWVAPGFSICSRIKSVLLEAELNPNCLYDFEIPDEERQAGKLAIETSDALCGILFQADDIPYQTHNCAFIDQLALTDKNISDAVEAILGTYLKNCGIIGALSVMNWFGVMCPKLATPEVFTENITSSRKGRGNPNNHLERPELIEKILNYKFRDRCYLLQALSHPTYARNCITTSYQKLEFLGDAVLDFLVTVHIFEKCTALSPGDLTDLRSALVNNITLACICVRNQFHKFLLHRSHKLVECMSRFIKHQEAKDHMIDNDILFLIEERETKIAEAIDVPKTLGDIVESLIGAVYLDSGKNLDVTWKVVYNLMRDEIENFHKEVPKNHVRMLFESRVDPQFSKYQLDGDGVVMVSVEILFKGQQLRFNGFGDNKRQAKRAAAKHALRYMRNPDN